MIARENEVTPEQLVDCASPRPWSYHNNGACDWIEDANGNTILNNVGYLDGPLIVACVNEAANTGVEYDFVETQRREDEFRELEVQRRTKAG